MALFDNLIGYVIIEPLSAKNHFTFLLSILGIMQKHPLDIRIENGPRIWNKMNDMHAVFDFRRLLP